MTREPDDAEPMESGEALGKVCGDLTYLDPGQLARVAKRVAKLMKLAAAAADTRSAEGKKEPEDNNKKNKYCRLRLDLRGCPRLVHPHSLPICCSLARWRRWRGGRHRRWLRRRWLWCDELR